MKIFSMSLFIFVALTLVGCESVQHFPEFNVSISYEGDQDSSLQQDVSIKQILISEDGGTKGDIKRRQSRKPYAGTYISWSLTPDTLSERNTHFPEQDVDFSKGRMAIYNRFQWNPVGSQYHSGYPSRVLWVIDGMGLLGHARKSTYERDEEFTDPKTGKKEIYHVVDRTTYEPGYSRLVAFEMDSTDFLPLFDSASGEIQGTFNYFHRGAFDSMVYDLYPYSEAEKELKAWESCTGVLHYEKDANGKYHFTLKIREQEER